MATSITCILRFADGGFGYLQNADVSTGTTGEELQTSSASNLINQVGSVSAGQAFNGRTVTHAVAFASTQNAYTASLMWATIQDAQGSIIVPIQGGGGLCGELPQLYKQVKLSTGMTVHAAWQAASDSATLYASLSVCSPNKCDVFFGQGSDSAAVELLNKNGSSIGQSMSGHTGRAMWAVYPSTIGMNNQAGGVSAIWVTAADGTAKAFIPPTAGGGGSGSPDSAIPAPVMTPVAFTQNDSAYVATDT